MVFTSHVTVFIMKHTKENVPATPSTFVIFLFVNGFNKGDVFMYCINVCINW